MLFLYLYIFAMAVMGIFFPKTMWKMRFWFSVKNGEPSEGYLIMTRIGGVILLIGLIWYLSGNPLYWPF